MPLVPPLHIPRACGVCLGGTLCLSARPSPAQACPKGQGAELPGEECSATQTTGHLFCLDQRKMLESLSSMESAFRGAGVSGSGPKGTRCKWDSSSPVWWGGGKPGTQPPLWAEPGGQGLNAAARGTTPHARAGGQLACHLSGLRQHSCADSASPDSDPGKQSAHAVPGIPIGAELLGRAGGRPPGVHEPAAPTVGLGRHRRHHWVPT